MSNNHDVIKTTRALHYKMKRERIVEIDTPKNCFYFSGDVALSLYA